MKHYINGMAVNTYEESNKPSIIFIQGFPFDQTMWYNQIEEFSKYNCITYDLRGVGESYIGDGQYTMEFYVEDLFSIISQLGLEKPILCGLSKGGYIALRAVERNQDLFSGLILCNTKSDSENDERKITHSESINLINTQGLGKYIDNFITDCFADETLKTNEDLFKSIYHQANKNYPLGVKGSILAMMTRTSTTNILTKIKIPTLVISGEKDKLIETSIMKAMAEKIPGAEFAVIPNVGHIAPLEKPKYFNELISKFLKKKFNVKN